MLVRLAEMVARRLRDHSLYARTIAGQTALFGFFNVPAGADIGSCTPRSIQELQRLRCDRCFTRPGPEERSGCSGFMHNLLNRARGRHRCSTKGRRSGGAEDACRRLTKIRDKETARTLTAYRWHPG